MDGLLGHSGDLTVNVMMREGELGRLPVVEFL